MGESTEDVKQYFPTVTIRKTKSSGSFALNFALTNPEPTDKSGALLDVLRLADDWTSYCISSLEFIPEMSAAGFFFVDHAITEDDMTFLSSIAIGKEEVYDEERDETNFSYILHDDDVREVAKRMATTRHMLRAAQTVQRSTLSSLIAEFDHFFSRFLAICAEAHPDKFYEPNEKIEIGELKKYSDFNEVICSRIERNVEKKLRGSHTSYIEWAYGLLALEAEPGKHKSEQLFKDFAEICQRRHLMSHSGGIVNEQYIKNCKAAGLKEGEYLPLGSNAQFDSKYLRRSTARVFLIGYFSLHFYMQKYFPEHRLAAYQNLLSTSHDFLEHNLTKMCERIVDFAEHSEKSFTNELRLKFGINRTLAKLFDPELDCEEQTASALVELEKYDWSVSPPIFELALCCLKRDFSELLPLAEKACEAGLDYSSAKTFVVFREAREVAGFMDCFPKSPLMIEAQKM